MTTTAACRSDARAGDRRSTATASASACAGDGPLIVLIHGITGRSDQWEPAIDHLARRPHACWRRTCSATASRRSRAATTRSAPTRAPSATRWSPSATTARRSSGTRSAAGSRCSSPTSSPSAASASSWSPAAAWAARSTRCCAPRPCPAPSGCCRCSRTPACSPPARPSAGLIGVLRLQAGTDLAEVARGFASLGDAEARSAFIETMRAVLDPGGQRVERARPPLPGRVACPRCWSGARPTRSSPPSTAAPRTRRCPAAGSSCSEGVGHFPQLERPLRVLARCSPSSSPRPSPAELDTATIRERLLAGRARRAASAG